ncbi:MAG: hypothetical protein LUG85_07555 [Clostridiales bacterium]|nr:hypothetical protein [Clostridiales bacterium]
MISKFTKKIFVYITVLCLLFSFSAFYAYAENYDDESKYGTGAICDTPETIEALLEKTPDTSIQATLPSSVDNTSKFPTPGNQGTSLSCAAWAVGYALM